MHPIHFRAHARGSSLVETLVATVLGLLVLVLSTNSVLAVVVGGNRSGAVRAVTSALEFARAEAAQRNTPVALCGLREDRAGTPGGEVRCTAQGEPWPGGWIVFEDSNLNGQLDDSEIVLRVTKGVPGTIRAQGGAENFAAITFRPIGTLASATPLRLVLSSDDAQSAVCIGIDGHARVLAATAACQ